ncbi:MAG TPA: acetyltransferase [Rickettsiales bacterium]|nr:acetyltransferase [Rickettsiales bacterium]
MKKLVIVGAGEFAHIAYEYFTHDSDYKVVGFAVEKTFITNPTLVGLPVIPVEEMENIFSPEAHAAFVAVTFTQLNRVRTRLYRMMKEKGYKLANYISSRAFVWRNVILGENIFVFENNVIQPFVTIGNNVVLWSGNHIGHQSVVQDNCFISSYVVVSGYCTIGENSFLGVNTTISDHITIAKDNFTRPATVITKNTEENTMYDGNPAVALKVPTRRFFKIAESL